MHEIRFSWKDYAGKDSETYPDQFSPALPGVAFLVKDKEIESVCPAHKANLIIDKVVYADS